MKIRVSNLTRPTPVMYSRIGNSIIMLVLAIQPTIIDANSDVLDNKTKFWLSLFLSVLAVVGKLFTMMLDNVKTKQ